MNVLVQEFTCGNVPRDCCLTVLPVSEEDPGTAGSSGGHCEKWTPVRGWKIARLMAGPVAGGLEGGEQGVHASFQGTAAVTCAVP